MAKSGIAAIAKVLRELAQRMELEGGNPYRARAYSRAADNLSLSSLAVDRLIAEGRLKEIPGIRRCACRGDHADPCDGGSPAPGGPAGEVAGRRARDAA